MKKVLIIIAIVLVVLVAGVFIYMKINNLEFAGELKTFTATGAADEISYRNYETNKTYTAFTDDTMILPAYTWIKTAETEAILEFEGFGTALLDKNTTVQVQLEGRGVYLIQLQGKIFHAVDDLDDGQVYNVETPKGINVVKGTGFGTEGEGTWTEDGEVIVIDNVEDHSNMSEEDVPDGPLIVERGRNIIVINRGRRWVPADNPGEGNRVGPGEEANYGNNGNNGRAGEVRPITGSTWRERARDFYNRLRDLENQRRTIGDAEYRDRLRALLNAYNATLPADIQPTDGQNLDCDNIRNFVIPHAMPAIEKLRSTEDMEATAVLIFNDLGGLTGVETFLNTVCDDNIVDAAEKEYLKKFNEVFAQQ